MMEYNFFNFFANNFTIPYLNLSDLYKRVSVLKYIKYPHFKMLSYSSGKAHLLSRRINKMNAVISKFVCLNYIIPFRR